MKRKTIHRPYLSASQIREGAVKINETNSFKRRLKKNLGLSKEKFSQKVWDIFEDKEETLSNKALAIQNLKNIGPKYSEAVLMKIVSRRERILSHDALTVLASIGTKKTFDKLSKLEKFSSKLLQRQKDFTMLLIGYRNHLPNTDRLLKKLIRSGSSSGNIEAFPVKFKMLEKRRISKVLEEINKTDYGVGLSKNVAFEIKVATQTFYFCFTQAFDDPSEWHKNLQTKQIAGQLLRKEEHANHAAKEYVALATPNGESAQLSIFRKDGQLFMVANVAHDPKKDTFSLENSQKDKDKWTRQSKSELKIDDSRVRINLTYIRQEKKKKTTVIED